MSLTPEVHALLYTATCQEFLSPVLHHLRVRWGRGLRLSATTIPPVATMAAYDLGTIEGLEVFRHPSYLFESFIPRAGVPRLLLLVADFDHPAHALGAGAVRRGRSTGMKSLSIQHGAVLYAAGTSNPYLFCPTADAMALWGDWYLDLFSGQHDAKRFRVTGNPRFCSWPIDRVAARTSVGRYWGLDEGSRRALLAISSHDCVRDPAGPNPPSQGEIVDFIGGVYSALDRAGITEVIVRPHPSDLFWRSISPYVRAAARTSSRIVFSNYYSWSQPSLLDVIGAVDLTVTQASSVGFYSAACGTPAVSIERQDRSETQNPYVDDHIYFEAAAANAGSVHTALGEVLPRMPSPSEIATDAIDFAEQYLLPGDAVDRVADLIGSMLELR